MDIKAFIFFKNLKKNQPMAGEDNNDNDDFRNSFGTRTIINDDDNYDDVNSSGGEDRGGIVGEEEDDERRRIAEEEDEARVLDDDEDRMLDDDDALNRLTDRERERVEAEYLKKHNTGKGGGNEDEDDEDDEGEDLMDTDMYEKDYNTNPLLDNYDEEMLDKKSYRAMTPAQRAAAEAEIRKREEAQQRVAEAARANRDRVRWLQRIPSLMVDDDDDDDDDNNNSFGIGGLKRRRGDNSNNKNGDIDGENIGIDGSDEATAVRRWRERRAQPLSKRRALLYEDKRLSDAAGPIEDEEEEEGEEEGGEDGGFGGGGDVLGAGMEHIEGGLREVLAREETRRRVGHAFRDFLYNFRADEERGYRYRKAVAAMCAGNGGSLGVEFGDLSRHAETLSVWLVEEPAEMLRIFDEAAGEVVYRLFPEYHHIVARGGIHVRIRDLPIGSEIRELRQADLNHLVKVTGVVTRRTSVFPQLVAVRYVCPACGFVIGPFAASEVKARVPQVARCPSCHSSGPFAVSAQETVYRNYQKITLHESINSVPEGRLPRSKDVVLLDDLIDSCKPGEEVDVIGVFKHSYDLTLNRNHGFPVFSTLIEANNIVRRDNSQQQQQQQQNENELSSSNGAYKFTEEEEEAIRRLARDERILERVAASVAPSIYGHSDVKLAITLALFGGQTRVLQQQGQHRIRGDINVLLLGDPGTAKSQFLKFVEKASHRAVFTTGKGSTAVGLTASVHRDPVTKEWTLEGGALVLADRGVCLIDEFDKMNDKDRTSIHEAMEQQSISISKAGIVTTLQARCSVIAAANPIKGRYDASIPLKDNVELTEPILSRFDVILVIRDVVDPVADENLARFVVQSHVMSHPLFPSAHNNNNNNDDDDENNESGNSGDGDGDGKLAEDMTDKNVIPLSLLKKYILYARTRIRVKWPSTSEFNKLSSIYAEMRQKAEEDGGFPICMRHVESAMRLAEASARLHLREYVHDSDLNLAIRIILESFIGTHKFSTARILQKHFERFLTYRKDNNEILYNILINLVRRETLFLHQQMEQERREHGDDFLMDDDDDDDDGEDFDEDDRNFGKDVDEAERERKRANKMRERERKALAIDIDDFQSVAASMKIMDCSSFFASKLFTNSFKIVDNKIIKKD